MPNASPACSTHALHAQVKGKGHMETFLLRPKHALLLPLQAQNAPTQSAVVLPCLQLLPRSAGAAGGGVNFGTSSMRLHHQEGLSSDENATTPVILSPTGPCA